MEGANDNPEECSAEGQPADYGSLTFWEAHFVSAPHGFPDDPKALEYEWICSDIEFLVSLMLPRLPPRGRLLHPGSGMSRIPELLRDAGLQVLSIDGSKSCVQNMSAQFEGAGLEWKCCDARSLETLGEVGFDGAVEKGCLDAMLCDSEESAAIYLSGLARVLAPSAPLLLVSNSTVRHRHLAASFELQEMLPLDSTDPFGGALYVCRRHPCLRLEHGLDG